MASSLRPSDWSRLTAEAFKGDLSELGWKGKFKYVRRCCPTRQQDNVLYPSGRGYALRFDGEPAFRSRYDDPEVVQLRSQLDSHAGIPELECVDPATPGFAQRAAFLLNRDGVRAAKSNHARWLSCSSLA
jgi:hypothetical protein